MLTMISTMRKTSCGITIKMKAREFILWFWQLPQILLGNILCLCYRKRFVGTWQYKYKGINYIVVNSMPGGGISLGNIVIMRYHPFGGDWDAWNHEWGHTRQSRYMGPLYLLVIGLPSVLWLLWHRSHRKHSYYWFYTEKWADKLGGVVRL